MAGLHRIPVTVTGFFKNPINLLRKEAGMFTKFFKYLLWALAVSALCQAAGLSPAPAQPGPGPGTGGPAALTTFETNDFSGSGICALCHSRLTDEAGNDVSNDAHWRSTMMANAAKDPLWQAKISSEVDRNPQVKSIIEDKCSRCHMGMARYQAKADGTDVGVLAPGFLDPAHYLHEAAMDGVSCTLCHQVQPDGLGDEVSYTGNYVIDTFTDPPNRLIFGPYDQVMQGPMQQSVGFLPTVEDGIKPHLTDSAHCGSCHTLYTPVLDAEGEPVLDPDTGEYAAFPEQTTYLEWKHSTVVESCQDCHLPEAQGKVVISNRPPFLTAREPFGQHHYVGGNSFMVNLLMLYAADLGVTADDVHLTATRDRTHAQLEENTAQLKARAIRTGDTLRVRIGVENLAGHKLPSGLPSRRCWLHVVVTDAKNKTIFESGKPLAWGGIEGDDGGDTDPGSLPYEPHYDIITSADQVQIYEPIMYTYEGTTGGYDEVTYTLLRAYSYKKDNRLLPTGFIKAGAPDDFAVYGAANDDENFIGGSDQITYEIRVAGAQGQLNVTVRLLYQTLSKPFVDDLANTDTELVNSFMGMYLQMANDPVVLAMVQPQVE